MDLAHKNGPALIGTQGLTVKIRVLIPQLRCDENVSEVPSPDVERDKSR